MNLLEYEAKGFLDRYGVVIPKATLLKLGDTPPKAPVVLKSQVHSGGRGKLGGVKLVQHQADVEKNLDAVFGLTINGEKPSSVLAEEMLDIKHEYYLALMINRSRGRIELVAHLQGGVEIEDQAGFLRLDQADGKLYRAGDKKLPIDLALSEYYGLEDKQFLLGEIVDSLYKCFVQQDATLLEINPLVLTTDGRLVAGDCKMIVDDSAIFRHPDWSFEAEPSSANFVELDSLGTVATVANGAGLAMATVDAVKSAGLVPANFLDIGGGATVESILNAFREIVKFPAVNAIIINIFGGIVRCDEVAKAIIEAQQQIEGLPSLYIRLSGTNAEEAKALLAKNQLTLYDNLNQSLEALKS